MINEIEIFTVDEWQLSDYLNKGYELVAPITETNIQVQNITEEVYEPQVNIHYGSSSGSTYGNNYNNNNNIRQVTKQVPIPVINTRFVLKRTKAARLLYEKSLNENNARNT